MIRKTRKDKGHRHKPASQRREQRTRAQILEGKRRGPGRETDYDMVTSCEIAANAALGGGTDLEIANALGIHVATFYRWQHLHPEFKDAVKIPKEIADQRVVRSMYHRAVGYKLKAVKVFLHKGKPVFVPYDEEVPPDPSMIKLWLINRDGENWKDKSSQEQSGPNGGPIPVAQVTASADTPDAMQTYLGMLKKPNAEPKR